MRWDGRHTRGHVGDRRAHTASAITSLASAIPGLRPHLQGHTGMGPQPRVATWAHENGPHSHGHPWGWGST